MADTEFRANLSAADFPFLSDFQGRSIVIPQFDQNFQKLATFSGGDKDRDIGIPRVMYLENSVPTGNGFQSCGYDTQLAAANPAVTTFDRAYTLRDSSENKFLLSPASGANFIANGNTNLWASVSPIGGMTPDTLVTVAYVQGRTFVCYSGIGLFEYSGGLFNSIATTGITASNIKAICGAVGYLVALIGTTVYWSSVTTPTDFVPSLSTGASSSNINDVRGLPITIAPTSNGFIIYTTTNAVSANYSGNIRYPWTFREIAGSAGVSSSEKVSWDSNLSTQYAWTTDGLQAITKLEATNVFPEVTDFLTAKVFESYDYSARVLTREALTSFLDVKLTVVGTRYLIISYKRTTDTAYSYALVHDLAHKRWGKLKITHMDCFEYPAINATGYAEFTQPRASIAFLQSDGTVKIANFDLYSEDHVGVFLLGKFQLQRTRELILNRVDVEEVVASDANFSLQILGTFDGKTFQTAFAPTLLTTGAAVRKYGCRYTAQNVTLDFQGTFDLVSIVVNCGVGGRPRAVLTERTRAGS